MARRFPADQSKQWLPKPLDFQAKFAALHYWLRPEANLKLSEYKVLARLIDRQNRKTGQCNPSVVRLMDDTGLCERSVRGAISSLQKKGAIGKPPRPRGGKRKYVIYSEGTLPSETLIACTGIKEKGLGDLQSVAVNPARSYMKDVQQTAYINKKEKDSEKRTPHADSGEKFPSRDLSLEPLSDEERAERSSPRSQERFEKYARGAFENKGYEYEVLVNLPTGTFEAIYSLYAEGDLTKKQAVAELLSEVPKSDT